MQKVEPLDAEVKYTRIRKRSEWRDAEYEIINIQFCILNNPRIFDYIRYKFWYAVEQI